MPYQCRLILLFTLLTSQLLYAGASTVKPEKYAQLPSQSSHEITPQEILEDKWLEAEASNSVIAIVAYVNGQLRRCFDKEERGRLDRILRKNAPINQKDGLYGSTALMFAAQRGDIELVRLLLTYKPSLFLISDKVHKTAAMFAAESDNLDTVQLFATLTNSIADYVSLIGGTQKRVFLPEELRFVENLLVNRADINQRDNRYQSTAIMIAVQLGDAALIKLLLRYHPDMTLVQKDKDIVQMALDAQNNAIIQILTDELNSILPICRLAYKEYRQLSPDELMHVNALLNLGAAVDEKTSYHAQTSLMYAVRSGDGELTSLLLRYGADPFIADNENHSAINHAEIAGKATLVEQMVRKQEARARACTL